MVPEAKPLGNERWATERPVASHSSSPITGTEHENANRSEAGFGDSPKSRSSSSTPVTTTSTVVTAWSEQFPSVLDAVKVIVNVPDVG